MRRVIQVIVSGIAAFFAVASVAQIESAEGTGDVEKGRQVYFDHACYACHAFNGMGRRKINGSASGIFYPEDRAITYIANNSSGVLVNEDVFTIFLRARANMNPTFPDQSMPNYPASSLSDEDARHLYAFVRTLTDEPPPVEEIPALQGILEDAEAIPE